MVKAHLSAMVDGKLRIPYYQYFRKSIKFVYGISMGKSDSDNGFNTNEDLEYLSDTESSSDED